MAAVLRAVALGEARGFVRMLIEAECDRILGLIAFGVEASEMMAAVQTAMLGGLPYPVLRDAIFTHPTAAEGLGPLLASVTAKAVQCRAGGGAPHPNGEGDLPKTFKGFDCGRLRAKLPSELRLPPK